MGNIKIHLNISYGENWMTDYLPPRERHYNPRVADALEKMEAMVSSGLYVKRTSMKTETIDV